MFGETAAERAKTQSEAVSRGSCCGGQEVGAVRVSDGGQIPMGCLGTVASRECYLSLDLVTLGEASCRDKGTSGPRPCGRRGTGKMGWGWRQSLGLGKLKMETEGVWMALGTTPHIIPGQSTQTSPGLQVGHISVRTGLIYVPDANT